MAKTLSEAAADAAIITPGANDPRWIAVRAIFRDFAADLPMGAEKSGRWLCHAGDRFEKLVPLADVPNGVYRIVGGDWLLTFEKNRLVAAEIATAGNQWGGAAVIAVPNEQVV